MFHSDQIDKGSAGEVIQACQRPQHGGRLLVETGGADGRCLDLNKSLKSLEVSEVCIGLMGA